MRVSEANSLFLAAQVLALASPTTKNYEKEKELREKWTFLRTIEECYFKQKSRVDWLKERDLNTAYFFRVFETRIRYNSIRCFQLTYSLMVSDPTAMSFIALNHFKSILEPDGFLPLQTYSHPTWFISLIGYYVPLELHHPMVSVPTTEEITRIMFRLNPNKAPDPEGLTSCFYKAAWGIIGEEVYAAIKSFFTSPFLPASTNVTIMSLIPKRPGSSLISDYRPIACLNTIYKVISGRLVKRLKSILPTLILPSQTVFVQKHLLLENTILEGELVNGYHKAQGPMRITLRVDIESLRYYLLGLSLQLSQGH